MSVMMNLSRLSARFRRHFPSMRKGGERLPDPFETAPRLVEPDRIVTVLAVSPLDGDHSGLAEVFCHSKWRIHKARSCREAIAFLNGNRIPVVICERELPDGDWKDLLEKMSGLSDPPLLIVTSRLADESLWAEVLNLGGYDVLPKPFDRVEVVRVVSVAWLHWKNMRQGSRLARKAAASSWEVTAALAGASGLV
jgi:DNA-binding NtrC family response regulator